MELPRRPGPSVRVRVEEYVEGRVRRHEDRLTTEEPLEVRVTWPGRPAHRVAVTMRTPGHDFELATGLLAAEGVLSPQNLASVAYCTDTTLAREQELNVVTVTLSEAPAREVPPRPGTVTSMASACGVCGTDSIEEVLALTEVRGAAPSFPSVSPEVLKALPDRLREAQRVFSTTGGLH